MKIISLVPSLTETLLYLGLEEQVIGRTKFCIHPQGKVDSIPRFGGTKNPNIEDIVAACPDLIIANKEENNKEDVERLIQEGIDVLVTDINNYDTALEALLQIGVATEKLPEAQELKTAIDREFDAIQPLDHRLNTAYFIWKNPYMTVGQGTFIHDMLDRCGFKNVFESESRYPTTDLERLKELDTEVVLLSSEPYPFKDKDCKEIFSQTKIPAIIVDGEYFSWYGSRMIDAPKYFNGLIKTIKNM